MIDEVSVMAEMAAWSQPVPGTGHKASRESSGPPRTHFSLYLQGFPAVLLLTAFDLQLELLEFLCWEDSKSVFSLLIEPLSPFCKLPTRSPFSPTSLPTLCTPVDSNAEVAHSLA